YFLKSQEKGFKMGIFASKKKTSEEQERRLNQFLNDLTTSFETNIQWKLREKITELIQSYELGSEELLKETQQISIVFEENDINKALEPLETQQEIAFENKQVAEEINQWNTRTDKAFQSPSPTQLEIERLEQVLTLRYKVKIEESPEKILPSAIQTETDTE